MVLASDINLFFFQAEDGIRDDLVTGVQTCALPICGDAGRVGSRRESPGRGSGRVGHLGGVVRTPVVLLLLALAGMLGGGVLVGARRLGLFLVPGWVGAGFSGGRTYALPAHSPPGGV